MQKMHGVINQESCSKLRRTMYRLTPNGVITQDESVCNDQDLLRRDEFLPGKSNDDIPWKWVPSDEFASEDFNILLELALRFGEPIQSGLIIDGNHVAPYYQIRELRRNQASRDSEALITAAGENDKFIPGYAEIVEKIDYEATEPMNAQIEEKQAAFCRILDDNPVDPRLRNHWTALGGRIPSAI